MSDFIYAYSGDRKDERELEREETYIQEQGKNVKGKSEESKKEQREIQE